MVIWYKVEKDKEDFQNFLDCNWAFHDYRIEHVNYSSKEDCVELFLLHDTGKNGAILRFVGLGSFHVIPHHDYRADWLDGSQLFIDEYKYIVWIASDDCDVSTVEAQRQSMSELTFVEANKLHWAFTDGEGNPIEIPEDRMYETREDRNGVLHQHHFDLRPLYDSD